MADATATPGVIAAPATLPEVSFAGDIKIQPAVIITSATPQAPTKSAGATKAAPIITRGPPTFPAFVVSAGFTTFPATISSSTTMGSLIVAASGTRPSTISAAVTINPPALLASGTSATTVRPMVILSSVTAMPTPSITLIEYVLCSRIDIDIHLDMDVTAQLAGYGQYAQDGRPPEYRVTLLTPDGTPLCDLENAQVGPLAWFLNGPGTFTFKLPVDDPKAANISVPDTEVQVWRGSDMLWQGVTHRARGDARTLTVQCVGLEWYFTKRHIGKQETNYVENGSFEAGLAPWSFGFHPYEWGSRRDTNLLTYSISNAQAIDGGKSLYMWADGQMVWGPVIAQPGFTWTPDPVDNPKGETWFLVCWVYIPSNQWIGPRWVGEGARQTALGCHLHRFSTTQTMTITGIPGVPDRVIPLPIEGVDAQLDDTVPKDMWTRIQVPLKQPITGEPEDISVQCYAPRGGVYWDNISLVRKEGLYFNNTDEALIVKGLVEHAQDPQFGKSDLRIGTDCPTTGVNRTREYEYFNHEKISDALDEWPALWDGVDWSIDTTPTTRTLRTHYPRRGSRKQRFALVLGKNISDLAMDVDGEATANSVLVMADVGEGAAREEGVASDPTTLRDGLVLEKVYVGTPGSTVNTLDAQARRGVRRYKDPVVLPDLVAYQDATKELLGMIVPGDVVPVNVVKGWYNLQGDYRITGIKLDPATETMTISLNPEVNWSLDP